MVIARRFAPIAKQRHCSGGPTGGSGGPVTWLVTSEPGEQVVETSKVPPDPGGYCCSVVKEKVCDPPAAMLVSAENPFEPWGVPGASTLLIFTPEEAKNLMQ